MKIKKLQAGGIPPLFSTFTPLTVTNPYAGEDPMLAWLKQNAVSIVGGASASGSSKSSSSSSSSGLPTMKDTMALLKDMKGLDSDVSNALYALQESASEAAAFGTTDSLISSYYRNINLVNKVNQSKEAYDEAYKVVKENGGIGEAAVTSDGRVIVKERGNNTIRAIDPNEYLKNRNKYQIQTNSNLLYSRAHDRSMAFNDSVLEIVQNGTSMEQISKFVNDIANKLGTSSESLSGYTAKQAQKIAGGIQALQEATKDNIQSMPMDGIYKITLKSDSQNEQASYAISAIYNSLTNSQKALLKLHSNGKDSGALELVKEMVMKNVSSNKEFTPSYEKELSKDLMGIGGGSDSDSGGEKSKSGVAGNWFLGYGNRSEYIIQDESNTGIHITGNDLPITKGGTSIGITTLDNVANGDYGGVLDFDNATMGNGMKLDPLGLGKVAVNGTTIVGAELPIDPENPNQPYFALLKNKSKADAELRKDYNISNPDSEKLTLEQKRQINEVYRNHKLPAKYDAKGNVVTQAYRRFGMITGTTTTDAFMEGVGDLDVSGMKDVTSRNERENYESVRKQSSPDKKYSIGNGWGPFDWFADDLYKGTIFVPVKNNYFNAISSSGSSTYPTVGAALGIEAAQQQTNAILNTLNTQKLQ